MCDHILNFTQKGEAKQTKTKQNAPSVGQKENGIREATRFTKGQHHSTAFDLQKQNKWWS